MTGEVLAIFFVAVLAYFLFVILRLETDSRNRALVLLILFAFGIVFWSLYNQDADTILLYIGQAVDRHLFGFEIPASSFLSINPLIIIVGAPLMSWLWYRLSLRGMKPTDAARFAIGLTLLACAYFLLSLAPTGEGGLVAPYWIVLFYIVFSAGELFVGPIGASMIGRFAPRELLGFAMGIWLMVHALGNYGSGLLAQLAVAPSGADRFQQAEVSRLAFRDYTLLALCSALLLFALLPLIHRLYNAREFREQAD